MKTPHFCRIKSNSKLLFIKSLFALISNSLFFSQFKISRLKSLTFKESKLLARNFEIKRNIQSSHSINNSNRNNTSEMAPQKYYAVQRGRETGVYSSWNECKQATSGYSGAVFKSFSSQAEASSFANSTSGYGNSGRSSGGYSNSSGSSGGYSNSSHSTGGYSNSSRSTGGYSNSSSYPAGGYSGYGGSSSTYSADYSNNDNYSSYSGGYSIPARSSGKINKNVGSTSSSSKKTVVYTDGASSKNGYASAKAGYGVFYGDNDPRNESAPLSREEPQTNQRAELHAIVHALKNAVNSTESSSKDIQVMTDSTYSRDCLTTWADKWEKNGYKSSTGGAVQNQDLIKSGRSLMKLLESQGGSIEIQHVKGHADNYGNNQADKLAVQGRNK